MELLTPAIKNYNWGSTSKTNLVYLLSAEKDFGANQFWAEAWVGSHPSGTATLKSNNKNLDLTFPFLLKVLEIEKCLSIQIHPDEVSAKELRAKDPVNYPDDQPKPELVVAIAPSEVFYGFAPVKTIRETFRRYETFLTNLSRVAVQQVASLMNLEDQSVKALCEYFSKAEPSAIEFLVNCLKFDLPNIAPEHVTPREPVLTQLMYDFPVDRGILLSLLLNQVSLKEGEALAVNALLPHAYIKGRVVECMAASDNVIRLGLTPKFKDTEAFLRLTDFHPALPVPVNKITDQKNASLTLTKFDAHFDKYFQLHMLSGQGDSGQSISFDHKHNYLGVNLGDPLMVNNIALPSLTCFLVQGTLEFKTEKKGNYQLFFAFCP